MSYYYWPQTKAFNEFVDVKERFDIVDERYFIRKTSADITLHDLINANYFDISCGSLISACSNEEYEETHCRNVIITSEKEHQFHNQTFEEVKSRSPLIHSTYGLSANALVELPNVLKLHDGLNNHSYVRICPELIFSFADDLKQEVLGLSIEQLEPIAELWQQAVLARYEVEEPEKVASFWFGWITDYDTSHYQLDYFKELLMNIYELLRSCSEEETLYVSVDY